MGCPPQGERSHGGPRESSAVGCPLGEQCHGGSRAGGAAGLRGAAVPLPGWWVPLGHGGTAGGAPRPLSLCPPRKIPQTAAEGLPSPPPWGSCSPCSCCSSTLAPAGTYCPRPPAFSPPQPHRQLSFVSSSISIPLPGPVEQEEHPLRCLGDPRDATPHSLPAAAKEESGCGQGLPGRAGTGSVPQHHALPDARTRKVALVPSARKPPSTSPIFLA